MKRLLNLFAYRFSFKTHKRNMYIVLGALTSNMIATLVLYLILYSGLVLPGIVVSLLVVFIIDVVLIALALVYQAILSTARIDHETAQENFNKETYVYNEAAMKIVVEHRLKRKKSEGLFAVLDIRDLSRLRAVYGQKGPRIINDALYSAIHDAVSAEDNVYCYSFSPTKGWFLFKKGGNVSDFLEELKHICQRVNYILEKDGTMPDVTILCGVYYTRHGESYEDAYNKAAVAATYNLSSRISSDVILYQHRQQR